MFWHMHLPPFLRTPIICAVTCQKLQEIFFLNNTFCFGNANFLQALQLRLNCPPLFDEQKFLCPQQTCWLLVQKTIYINNNHYIYIYVYLFLFLISGNYCKLESTILCVQCMSIFPGARGSRTFRWFCPDCKASRPLQAGSESAMNSAEGILLGICNRKVGIQAGTAEGIAEEEEGAAEAPWVTEPPKVQ